MSESDAPAEVEGTPADRLNVAIQTFLNEIAARDGEDPALLDTAIVVWEEMQFNEEGDLARRVNYCVPTPRASLSSTIGLLEVGASVVMNDLLGDDGD